MEIDKLVVEIVNFEGLKQEILSRFEELRYQGIRSTRSIVPCQVTARPVKDIGKILSITICNLTDYVFLRSKVIETLQEGCSFFKILILIAGKLTFVACYICFVHFS